MFGTSEYAARSLSAVFGILTVAVVFKIGRQVGGADTALWSAFFAACSPLMIEYSRETRMYSLLVLLTCLAWWNLLRFRERSTRPRMVLQAVLLSAMIYSHPLALLMVLALGMGWVIDRSRTRLGPRSWLMIHIAAAALVAPWIRHYFDHAPEFTTGRLPIKFLLGVPIGFTGGDSRVLIVFLGLLFLGLRPIRGLSRYPKPATAWPLVVWLAIPPIVLYAYSLVSHPIFGPSRYNVFVAPAYLILVARGVASLGRVTAALIGGYLVQFVMTMAVLSIGDDQGVKADWRRAALILARDSPGAPVVVISPTPGRNFEFEVARYYLVDGRKVIPMSDSDEVLFDALGDNPGTVVFVASRRGEAPLGDVPEVLTSHNRNVSNRDVRGLRLYWARNVRR
ncbi:MAG: hypothetical protein JWN86_3555 [Planctomycetota bacterium]|nr:hypothetical protein [Planctomycetota bacterium]